MDGDHKLLKIWGHVDDFYNSSIKELMPALVGVNMDLDPPNKLTCIDAQLGSWLN